MDFADSGGDIHTDIYCACKSIEGVNVLDAFQRLEDTTGAVEGIDEMDIGELVGAAIASPLDTSAIDAAVEACNNINTADITSPTTTNEAGVDTARKRKLDITNLEKNEEKKKEKKQQKHEDVSPVSSNIGQTNRDDDGK